ERRARLDGRVPRTEAGTGRHVEQAAIDVHDVERRVARERERAFALLGQRLEARRAAERGGRRDIRGQHVVAGAAVERVRERREVRAVTDDELVVAVEQVDRAGTRDGARDRQHIRTGREVERAVYVQCRTRA